MKKRCEKCRTKKNITKHHVLPRFFYKGQGGICRLCAGCHEKIEKIIQTEETLHSKHKAVRFNLGESIYRHILGRFLSDNSDD